MRTRNLPSSAMPSLHLSNRWRSIRSRRGYDFPTCRRGRCQQTERCSKADAGWTQRRGSPQQSSTIKRQPSPRKLHRCLEHSSGMPILQNAVPLRLRPRPPDMSKTTRLVLLHRSKDIESGRKGVLSSALISELWTELSWNYTSGVSAKVQREAEEEVPRRE